MKRLAYLLTGVILLFASVGRAAERFDDIVVAPQSLHSGDTHHGYSEVRVMLENQSLKETHLVTLIFPARSYGGGNSLRAVSRTVSLNPSSRAIVPLWQPPLPANGNGQMQVLIDGGRAGTVNLMGGQRHMTQSGSRYGGSPAPATFLVSRSLNYDEVSRSLQSLTGAFTANMATGAPDSSGPRGGSATSWMPDRTSSGPHWIELDYMPPLLAHRINIHHTAGFSRSGEIILTGVSGTNLARISMSKSTYSPSSRVIDLSFPLTAEPVKTVRLEFGYAPPGSVAIDAVELSGPSGSAWAVTARASSEARGPLASASYRMPPGYSGPVPVPYGGSTASGLSEFLRAELPVTEWSEYWLSYTPYDAVILNAADFSAMPAGVAATLWRYAESGGNLVLLGGGNVPETWRSGKKKELENGTRFDVGFGRCFVFEKQNPSGLSAAAIKSLNETVGASARYWQSLPAESQANANFPVVENFQIPVRGTVFIMLVFVLLIGPVNMIVLARLKKRIWMLWTIPAISFVTCLVVLLYSLLREGVTPDVRLEGLTLLDQVNRRAVSIGQTAFYCPLTPSQGLFFGPETEATPLVEMWDYQSGTQREVDWSQSQHLRRGWITARVPAHFLLRKSETRRERLQLESAAGQVSVVNGLGTSIRSLWLADQSGKIFTALNIPAGQNANLVPAVGISKVTDQLGARTLFEKLGHVPPQDVLATNAVSYLVPGSYIVELAENPFLENGLGPKAKSARTKARAVVYGILEPPRSP